MTHEIEGLWDLIIAHPPCTYLTITGNRWFGDQYGTAAKGRYYDRLDAITFFMRFALCSAKRVAIENPIGIMSSVYRKPDQIIQPWWFSDGSEDTEKATCLWLKNLPQLIPVLQGLQRMTWVLILWDMRLTKCILNSKKNDSKSTQIK